MYEIQWFKVDANIFSNRKIQIILKLPDGDTYFRVWIQLIALSIECHNNGKLELGENIPMRIQDFSKILGKSKRKIENILNCFLKLQMLILEDDTYIIKNWNKYQSLEMVEKYQEQNRLRQQKYREKLKLGQEKGNVRITLSNEGEKKREDTEENKIEENKKENNIKQKGVNENGFKEYELYKKM